MKLAVLADIHSNYYAFSACVEWIEKNDIDGIVFLGDYVSDCAEPQKTLKLIYELQEQYKTWFVRGNREDAMIDGNIDPSLGSLKYTYENLTNKDIEFFKTLPLSAEIKLKGKFVISATHGDFHDYRGIIYPENYACKRLLEEMPGSLHLCGHTHHAFIFEKNGKIIVNPGSVGASYDKLTKAQMAVIEINNDNCKPMLLEIEYDIEKTILEICESELYIKDNPFARMVIATIRTGHDYKTDANVLYSRCIKNGCRGGKELWNEVMDKLGI